MNGWVVLVGLIALLLGVAFARRRMLREPGDHLGEGSHVFDGRDDGAASAIDRRETTHDAEPARAVDGD